jgi:N4-gp56 family major capsid protein
MTQNIKELLTTGAATEGSLLMEKKIYDTLWEAVMKSLIGRSYAAIDIAPAGIPGSSIDIDLVTPDSMKVYSVAEGGAIPLDTLAFTSINMKPVKYGVRIAVTKEMMEDGKWDMAAFHIKQAGVEMAENLDSRILTALDGATNAVSGGAAITINNITTAMQYLEDNDYTPTTLLVGAEVANDLRNIDTFVEAEKFGSTEMMSNGFVGRIYGMDVVRFSSNIGTKTSAYVIDKNQAFAISEKIPDTVEK